MAHSSSLAQHVTLNQRLDWAVHRYWQRAHPGKPGRVLIPRRNVRGGYPAARRTAAQLKPPPKSVTRRAAALSTSYLSCC